MDANDLHNAIIKGLYAFWRHPEVRQRFFCNDMLDIELHRRAAIETADYIYERLPGTLRFPDKWPLFDHCLKRIPTTGLVLEFGVYRGQSINHIARRLPGRPVYGFDSFEGIDEDFHGTDLAKGGLSLGGVMPSVEANVTLVKGWFNETLPGFLERNPGPVAFINIDSDTYASTRTVLELCRSRFVPGTVINFDEYFNYPFWRMNEWKAFQEFVATYGVRYEYLGYAGQQAAVRILAMGG
ncbi:class I SAM-dependent methyltransferase [Azospirillum sp. RWY-5-1]|uniref:Class I SAM-dependent methyltransferase n=1 Tax=Azospirillum oleiclasticum TaxID=2735135 RepID=A0ABX2TL01_9PROT|nr:class I SAM-dependent methyltransferase [Azospirillum oleiclasticum]NYZ17726.1 class I SAM-dependent methyltransferase [Azospirillum oleiclasticum]NYZ24973.1 class I SAM-dependent methyltransferase [Azospirillum oleiclasticum]